MMFHSISGRIVGVTTPCFEALTAYFAWAKQKYSQVTHNSTIGRALAYSINQEEYLRVFLSDGHIPMDNNYALSSVYFYPHLLPKLA